MRPGSPKNETGLLFELGGNWIVATITVKVETITQEVETITVKVKTITNKVETIEANLTLQLTYNARIR